MIKLNLDDVYATKKDLGYLGNLGKVKNLKVLDLSLGLNYSQEINLFRMEINQYSMVEVFDSRFIKYQT